MAKLKRCKACGAEIAKSAKICPRCGAKNKGSKKTVIIVIIVLFFLISIIGGAGESEEDEFDNDQFANSSISSDEPEFTEEEREEAKKVDETLYNAMLEAEKYYNDLLTIMSEAGTAYSLYDVYTYAEDLEKAMNNYSYESSLVSDKNAKDYADACGMYFYSIGEVAKHVKNYANSSDMKQLSKAEDAMETIEPYATAALLERLEYLLYYGFTEEEIFKE